MIERGLMVKKVRGVIRKMLLLLVVSMEGSQR